MFSGAKTGGFLHSAAPLQHESMISDLAVIFGDQIFSCCAVNNVTSSLSPFCFHISHQEAAWLHATEMGVLSSPSLNIATMSKWSSHIITNICGWFMNKECPSSEVSGHFKWIISSYVQRSVHPLVKKHPVKVGMGAAINLKRNTIFPAMLN